MSTSLDNKPVTSPDVSKPGLLLSDRASLLMRLTSWFGHGILLAVTSSSAFAVLFIFFFILRDAMPFFQERGFYEFFFKSQYYPSAEPPAFGAFPIFFGSFMVTFGAITLAVPLGVSAAVCLSDVLPFSVRQLVKPMIEILAAIPSVAYGFFALVILAPLLQNRGGLVLAGTVWVIGAPLVLLLVVVLSDLFTSSVQKGGRTTLRGGAALILAALGFGLLYLVANYFGSMSISSGTNALNVSLILGIMALPTVVSVSEDALQAVGRELREGSYALGATRAETIVKVVLPAASSGICAAVILGIMRAVGETMVVWMASGNAAQVPEPWYNFLEPVRTLTATIAGDMGEADQVTGSARYHVLFAMAASLLVISLICNLFSERIVARATKRSRGE
jgi:phosphate transport system permease protein